MNTTEDVINEIKQLPEPLQREVLNYAHFLKYKYARAEHDSSCHLPGVVRQCFNI